MLVNRKWMSRWVLISALLLSMIFPSGVFAATGDVLSIDIEGSSSTLELTVGKTTKQLKVWATVEGSTVKRDVTGNVTWSSNDNSIIKVENGFLTPLKAGTTMIKATHGSAISTIEVKAVETYKKLDLSYSLEGKYTLGNTEEQLKVKATAKTNVDSATPLDVTEDAEWTTSNGNVLTISKGQITLVGEGSATITAKYSGLTATFKATVSSPYTALRITKEGSSDELKELELVVGDSSINLNAKSSVATDNSLQDVTEKGDWTSSDVNVATVENGKLTILATGKTTIKVNYLGVTAEVDAYVRSPYEAIMLTPSEDIVMFIGEKWNAKAEVRSGVNATQDVTTSATWSSSNQLPVTVNAGLIEAKAVGDSVIKVSYHGVSKSINVKVLPTVVDITAKETELDMLNGDTTKLPAITAKKLDNESMDFDKYVKWTSSREDIATISEDGKVVAKSSGTVKLTAQLPEANITSGTSPVRSKTVDVTVTIKEKVLTILSDPERLVVVVGEEQSLPSITVVLENGNEQPDFQNQLTWKLTGSNGVLKDATDGKKIKGLTKGSAVLKGTYSNKEISIPVTFEQKITKIVVDPTNVNVNVKSSKSIKVTGYYKDGKTVNLSTKMNWQLSNSDVVTLNTSSVRGVNEGTVTLSGSYQGHNATVTVNVVPKLKKLYANTKRINAAPGSTQNVVVTAEYDTGKTAIVTNSVNWTSSKPAVAKMNAGRIEAIAKGTATIKGKFDGKTISITVVVK